MQLQSHLLSYDKEKTFLAKAILPLLIILHHSASLQYMQPFSKIGIPVVCWFFLMSGYGLMYSFMNKKDYIAGFLSKRLSILLVPFVMAAIVYGTFTAVIGGGKTYFADLNLGNIVPDTWFVVVILIAYVVFWLIFRLKLTIALKVSLFLALSALYYVIGGIVEYSKFWYASELSIPIGMLWYWYESKIIGILRNKVCIIVFLIITLALRFLAIKYFDYPWLKSIINCAVFILVMYALPNIKFTGNNVIRFLSRISYETYLMQGIIIEVVIKWIGLRQTLVAIPLILLLTFVTAYILKPVSAKLQKLF